MIVLALRFVLCSINILTLVIRGFVLNFYFWLWRIISVPTQSVIHRLENLSDACEQHEWTPALFLPLELYIRRGFPHSAVGKESPAMQEIPVRLLGREDLLEKGSATHSGILGLSLWLSW